jgi:hypothetical protein
VEAEALEKAEAEAHRDVAGAAVQSGPTETTRALASRQAAESFGSALASTSQTLRTHFFVMVKSTTKNKASLTPSSKGAGKGASATVVGGDDSKDSKDSKSIKSLKKLTTAIIGGSGSGSGEELELDPVYGTFESDFLPFYSVGNGDHLCLRRSECPNSAVYFVPHDEPRVTKLHDSFDDYLRDADWFY